MNIAKTALLYSIFTLLACSEFGNEQTNHVPTNNKKPAVVWEPVQIGSHAVQFYVDFGSDSAVLGFSSKSDFNQQQYCPIYGSTYRGMPAVTLDIFTPDPQNEMWVLSSWPGYKTLAYYELDTDWCVTQYGEIAFTNQPTPDVLGGKPKPFPKMNIEKVSKVATFKLDRTSTEVGRK